MRPVQISRTDAGSTAWVPLDYIQSPFNVGIMCEITAGTPNYTVQVTYDDIFDPAVTPTAIAHDTLAAQTSSADGQQASPVRAARLTVNSGSGTVKMTLLQGLG
jgi:hypothetical protein